MRNKRLITSPIYFFATLFYILFGNIGGHIMQDGFHWGKFIILLIVFMIVSTLLDFGVERKAHETYSKRA